MKKYSTVEKLIGETPLEATEKFRSKNKLDTDIPLAYAGRLDPMASGRLLILLGEECRQQEKYHDLDKEYIFEVLLGVGSDTGDVLGLLEVDQSVAPVSAAHWRDALQSLTGDIQLPYPQFSSKTVEGKPLHTWTLEKRLDEITIPTKDSTIYKLKLLKLRQVPASEVARYATEKIETIKPVKEASKALGNDFRRPLVRESWEEFKDVHTSDQTYQIATVKCIASSGTYMRTLADEIAKKLGTKGLAYSIHRSKIGKYKPLPLNAGMWLKKFYQA